MRDTTRVEPPLRRQWKEKECARPTSFPSGSAYRARLATCPVRSHSSMFPCERKTRVWPGLGTWARPRRRSTDFSIAPLRTAPAVRGACVGVHTCVRVRSHPTAGVRQRLCSCRSQRVRPISTRSTSLRTNTRRGNADQRTSYALLLCCAAARHLAVRADSLPRDDEAIATPRNARAHARPE